MIDHISLPVSDYARSRAFYDKALGALGYKVAMEITDSPDFVGAGYGAGRAARSRRSGSAPAREPGRAAGLARRPAHRLPGRRPRRGRRLLRRERSPPAARDNGPPGLRPHYHPSYYAAFVLDPDGHRLEAVCHRRSSELTVAGWPRSGRSGLTVGERRSLVTQVRRRASAPAPGLSRPRGRARAAVRQPGADRRGPRDPAARRAGARVPGRGRGRAGALPARCSTGWPRPGTCRRSG